MPSKALDRQGAFPLPLTRFIGREQEVAMIANLLRDAHVRLVTLTGPGGVGKTRLALRVAEVVGDESDDGVVFVPFAAIERPEFVLPTIARALGVREVPGRSVAATLGLALRYRRLLLVLDNFEHLLGATNDLGQLLASCPRLTMLVTSREALRLSGERRVAIPPLALPSATDTLSPEHVSTFEAIMLFSERAQHVQPAFSLDAGNAATVLQICRRLEGLPLAIELAAAWLRVLAPADLLSRLDQRLPLLTAGAPDHPARHHTMRDAIAWSFDLLPANERQLMCRLAVFVGGFSLDTAGTVEEFFAAGDEPLRSPLVLGMLTALIDKSLLQVEHVEGSESRFQMLDMVREYALERLGASGEEAAAREAHAVHYLTLAEAAMCDAGGAADRGWMRRLAAERPNVWAALDWLERAGRISEALQMTGALWHYWYRLGDLAEGRTRLERALAAAPLDVEPTLRARALRGAGVLAWQGADYDVSRERLEAALAIYRALSDQTGVAWTLNSLGCLCATLSAAEQAEICLGEALAIFRDTDDAVGIANLTSNLGELAEAEDQHELAIARLEAGLAMWRVLGDRVGAVRASFYLGQALLALGGLVRAEDVLMQALKAIHEIDYQQILPAALRAIAQLNMRRGDAAAAACWYGAADGVMTALGMELSAARREGHERHLAAVRERLEETEFAAAWAEGHKDSRGIIFDALAKREDAATLTERSEQDSRSGGDHFTRRQREVLHLMALGQSDKEIACALYISRATASKHVAAIMAKLAVDSRTAAVATAIRLGLT